VIYTIGLNHKSNKFREIPAEVAVKLIEGNRLICEDTETKGLDPHMPNPLKLIQIGTLKHQFVFTPDTVKCVKHILEDKKVIKILVNGVFERTMLRSIGIQLNSMFDLSLAYQVYRQGKPMRQIVTEYGTFNIYSLAGMYSELLGLSMSKEQQTTFIGTDSNYTEAQLEYAAKDVKLFDLYEVILSRLIKDELITESYEFDEVQKLVSKGTFRKAILEFKYQEYLADMLYNGINIDDSKWRELETINRAKAWELEASLNKEIIETVPKYKDYRIPPIKPSIDTQTNLFGFNTIKEKKVKDKRRVNWKSPKQVKEVLNELNIKIPKVKGKETIGIVELDKIKGKYPMLSSYIKYKKFAKLVDSFGLSMLEKKNKHTGRIHFQVTQLLNTGRIAPRKPNMAQIPSAKEWRNCFTPQHRGRKMVGADYSAQESRVMSYKSKDTAFMNFFENGDGDSHSMVASRVYSAKTGLNVKVHKYKLEIIAPEKDKITFARKFISDNFPKAKKIVELNEDLVAYGDLTDKDKHPESCPLRQKGKVLNFFISFGGSAFTLSQSQGISMKEANELLNGFWEGFPELREYFDAEKEFGLNYGYSLINSVTRGRRTYPEFKDIRSIELAKKRRIDEIGLKKYRLLEKTKGTPESNGKIRKNILKGIIERASMNSGIQGTAADMTKTSAILFMEKLESLGYDLISVILPVNMIHDEHLDEVIEELATFCADILKRAMEEASVIFIGVKIPAVPYIGNEWQH